MNQYAKVLSSNGHKDVTVSECGLFVHPEHIYMAASPDAVVSCTCCGKGLLEVKCSLTIAHASPQLCPPAYPTQDDSGVLKLKTSHPYHTQVVMQLAVTGYKWCDFVVFPMGTICRESTKSRVSV